MNIADLYKLAESKGINVYSYSLPDINSLSVKDPGGDYHIAINPNTLSSLPTEKTCLAHEISHCETDAFYTLDASKTERGRIEYRADKHAIIKYLVPWDLYVEAILKGFLAYYEQAEFWGIPEEYVPIVHLVYERTHWDDVVKLRRKFE